MRVWAARAVYGLALGGAVLFIAFISANWHGMF